MEGNEQRRAPIADGNIPESRSSWWGRHAGVVQVLAVVALLAGVVYLTWRIGWSGRGAYLPLYFPLLAAEIFGWLSLAFYAFLAWSVPPATRRVAHHTVPVDVFVCTYDEPVQIVEPTLIGCRAITAPHTTYLLDDGRRPEMEELAKRLGAQYVTRPDNAHAKAGNINHALTVTDGELILMLDADHVPLPHILDATVGYFEDDDVALVQTPHDFSNRDSVQHTKYQRHEQSLFYSVIAPGKDRHNAMFWCGSATVVRRRALEAVGGVLTDTVAEDFHTTIAMHAQGWRTRYDDGVLVQGRAPHDLAGFLLQRARWARGNLGVFRTRENPLTCRGLTPKQRVSYFSSLFNYFSGLQRLTLLLVLIATLVSGRLPMHTSLVMLLAFWLPWSVLAFVATLALGRGTLGPLDSTRYGLATMGIYLRGIVALVFRSAGRFDVTPKEGVDDGGLRVLRMLGLCTTVGAALLIAVILRVLTVAGVVALPTLPEGAVAVVIALGVWELYCFARTLVPFVRHHQRRSRFRTDVTMRARIDGTTVRVDVVDITPEGAALNVVRDAPLGARLTLLSRLPDVTGHLYDVALPVEVRSTSLAPDGEHHRWGCRFVDLDPEVRERLVEFCDVVLPRQRLARATEPAVAAAPGAQDAPRRHLRAS